MAEEKTTIKVSKKTAEKLRKLGTMGDSYDDVVKRLLKQHHNEVKIISSFEDLKKVSNDEAMNKIYALSEQFIKKLNKEDTKK